MEKSFQILKIKTEIDSAKKEGWRNILKIKDAV